MITVIIVFLNEQEEVKYTLDSLYSHIEHEIDVILINDCSDDTYDYLSDIKKYSVRYVENKERLGVAKSRDLGVSLSETPYFLFLDAHMRFYDCNWYQILLNELLNDKRCIICSQTKILKKVNGQVCECENEAESYGAYTDLFDPLQFFELRWLFTQSLDESNNTVIDIPCIIGAAYACNKDYWLYLNGLWGLERYGLDEAYICIKVWLEGGRCKLAKNFITGHIYRTNPPYCVEDLFWIYNKILVSFLLLPSFLISKLLSKLKFYVADRVDLSLQRIYGNIDSVLFYRKYYKQIFVNNFNFYYRKNFRSFNNGDICNSSRDLLDSIFSYVHLYVNTINSDSLTDGRLGVVLFFFHYARFADKMECKKFANQMLLDTINRIWISKSYLYELGWLLEYLYQNKFLEMDAYANIKYIDESLLDMGGGLDRDWDSLGMNIIRYLLSRLYAIQASGMKNPYSDDFLKRVYLKCLLNLKPGVEGGMDLYMRFVLYYENKMILPKPSIYDLLYIFVPKGYVMEDLDLGLDGNSGVGLSIILENSYHDELLFNN